MPCRSLQYVSDPTPAPIVMPGLVPGIHAVESGIVWHLLETQKKRDHFDPASP
jgi:hypothetical protein